MYQRLGNISGQDLLSSFLQYQELVHQGNDHSYGVQAHAQ
jgi:hypothetical protein